MAYHFKLLLNPLICAPICLYCLQFLLRKAPGDAAIYFNDLPLDRLGATVCTEINYFLRSVHTFHTRCHICKILFETNLLTHTQLGRKPYFQSGRVHALALNYRLFLSSMDPTHFTNKDDRGKTIDSL